MPKTDSPEQIELQSALHNPTVQRCSPIQRSIPIDDFLGVMPYTPYSAPLSTHRGRESKRRAIVHTKITGAYTEGQLAISELELIMAAAARQLPPYLIREFNNLSVPGNQMDYLRLTIYVKTMSGKIIPVICWRHSYVSDVKEAICTAENIPTNRHRLVHGGQQLEDQHRLLQCGVGDRCYMDLVLRLRGGGARAQQTGEKKRSPFFPFPRRGYFPACECSSICVRARSARKCVGTQKLYTQPL